MDYKAHESEKRRVEALIKADGSGAAVRWASLATGAMGGNATARAEVERLLGYKVENLGQLALVQWSAIDCMTPGERALDYGHARQALSAGMRPDAEAIGYLANRLGAMRREMGWTQERLAKESGVTLVTLQKLENGTNSLLGARAETVANIARALGKTVEEVIGK